VYSRDEIDAALQRRQIPVLAPSRWLLTADPLPHSWDVTSDSIAAWVAAELDASRLLLIKPPGARGADLTDPHFRQALPAQVAHECLPADEAIERLRQMGCNVNAAFETT